MKADARNKFERGDFMGAAKVSGTVEVDTQVLWKGPMPPVLVTMHA